MRPTEIRLGFHGAARNVTGSRYLLEAGRTRVLIDCGLYQERDFRSRNWDRFPVPPGSLDAVILTHAHADHCGLLPKLVREGFRGKIYCTPATSDISGLVLMDSAHLQAEDAAFKKERHEKEGRRGPFPEKPLYSEKDAQLALKRFRSVEYRRAIRVARGVEAVFYDAGHILGSSMVKVKLAGNGEERTVLFSGDLGRWGAPLLNDPTLMDSADYVVIESTYGNRIHESYEHIPEALAEAIRETHKAGGNVVIPSFAVERTQDVLYYLSGLLREDRIPHIMVFVDSPMATHVTDIMRRHPELLDKETLSLIRQGSNPCDFPGLQFCQTVEQSKAVNHIRGTVIIIAGSGMCTGGRIKHHLAANIRRPESTILFVGYQAVGTLGRQIVDGAPEVRIHGQIYPVRARVTQIPGFSAHADQEELFRWLSALQRPPRHVFVTHGEPESAESFARLVEERKGWKASAPVYGEKAALE